MALQYSLQDQQDRIQLHLQLNILLAELPMASILQLLPIAVQLVY